MKINKNDIIKILNKFGQIDNSVKNSYNIIEAGFIAQDILKINDISYSVSVGDPSGNIPYSLNYNNIFIYGISAIQEVDKQLQEMDKQLHEEKENTITLQKQYDDLLSRVLSLENK